MSDMTNERREAMGWWASNAQGTVYWVNMEFGTYSYTADRADPIVRLQEENARLKAALRQATAPKKLEAGQVWKSMAGEAFLIMQTPGERLLVAEINESTGVLKSTHFNSSGGSYGLDLPEDEYLGRYEDLYGEQK